MDDIIVIGNDFFEMRCLKEVLAKEFEIKDFGKPKIFLRNGSCKVKRWDLGLPKKLHRRPPK